MTKRFNDISFVCCRGPVDTGYCMCSRDESTLRRYSAGEALRPMTADERAWCVDEAYRAGEGYYNSEHELMAMDDKALAGAVLNAWHMYVRSNCL
jgi:hypothetical protein